MALIEPSAGHLPTEPAFTRWEVWALRGPSLPPVKRQRNAKRAPVPISERHLGVAARPPPRHRPAKSQLVPSVRYARYSLHCRQLLPMHSSKIIFRKTDLYYISLHEYAVGTLTDVTRFHGGRHDNANNQQSIVIPVFSPVNNRKNATFKRCQIRT